LKSLQVALRSGIGALETALGLPKAVEPGELRFGVVILEDIYLNDFHSGQFPLRDRHLLDIELFGPGLGMPFEFQIVAKVVEFGGIFARQHDGAGAESVTEGIHADSRFALGGFGASRFLRVSTIGLELFERCHSVFLTNKAKLSTGRGFLCVS
jgi:hypothetical protein